MGLRPGIAIVLVFIMTALPLAHASEVRGSITMEPPFPLQEKITVKKKTQDSCANEQLSQGLVVSSSGDLKNALVYLKGNFEGKFPVKTPVIDQKSCNFEPHVQIVASKGLFQVANSDPLAHDVRIFQNAKMISRFEIGAYEKPIESSLENPGIYLLRCGLHSWMHAYVVNAPHPFYAVSNANGEVLLKDVPEGKHVLAVWHEKLGQVEIPLEVTGAVTEFVYQFKNPESRLGT